MVNSLWYIRLTNGNDRMSFKCSWDTETVEILIEGEIVETLHQIIEGKILSQVIELPNSFRDMLVEVTVKPVIEQTKPNLSRSELRAQLDGSHTELLSGVLQPQTEIILEEMQKERRTKYESFD